MPDHQTSRLLPAPSRADRNVANASKGHCTAFAVLGDGAGVRMQAESHLELSHLFILNAKSAIADLREQVRFRYGPRGAERVNVFDMLATRRDGTRIWIAARRALKAQGPREDGAEEAVVFKAIEDIRAMGAHRSLQFGLIDKTWTEKELDHLEASLLANFRITPTVPAMKACDDGHGRSITPQAPVTDDPAGLGVPTPSVRGGGPLRFEE